jgi:hypothetical protein
MVSRNDPCPCGSGQIYKNCCERVVAIELVGQIREGKEREQKNECLQDLNTWFKGYFTLEKQTPWADYFKKLLELPLDQAIPENFRSLFHSWLMFDAPCVMKRRAIEFWMMSRREELKGKERVVQNLLKADFVCFEVLEVKEDSMVFRSLFDQSDYEVIKEDTGPIEEGKIVFTRLICIGNRYEICSPFISFMHEMKGEILVQLEKYSYFDDEQEYNTREQGWKVFGWTIQRARELEKIEKIVSASPEMYENMREAVLWPAEEPKSEQSGLPMQIIQQMEQFYVNQVAPLQKITQTLYSRSLEMLYQYLSLRFGYSFDWSNLTEDDLSHYLSVWYLENAKATPTSSKIFLNTTKHLFRWLYSQGISDAYLHFRKVYISLIRALPTAIEVRNWLKNNAIYPLKDEKGNSITTDIFMLAISPSGPVLLVKNRWKPIHLRSFPSTWSDYRFWIKGTIQSDHTGCSFVHMENLYPMVTISDQFTKEDQVLGHK